MAQGSSLIPLVQMAKLNLQYKKTSKVSLQIYDLNGRHIKTIADKFYEEGLQQLSFETNGMSNGIYMLRLQAGELIETKKLVVLK